MQTTAMDAESKATRPRTPRLRLIEKRSIVYARLPAELKSFQPDKVAYIPYATMAWIESLLKKGGTDWPWFAAVLKFINSSAYRALPDGPWPACGNLAFRQRDECGGLSAPAGPQ